VNLVQNHCVFRNDSAPVLQTTSQRRASKQLAKLVAENKENAPISATRKTKVRRSHN
jgi:hypothetical protein